MRYFHCGCFVPQSLQCCLLKPAINQVPLIGILDKATWCSFILLSLAYKMGAKRKARGKGGHTKDSSPSPQAQNASEQGAHAAGSETSNEKEVKHAKDSSPPPQKAREQGTHAGGIERSLEKEVKHDGALVDGTNDHDGNGIQVEETENDADHSQGANNEEVTFAYFCRAACC